MTTSYKSRIPKHALEGVKTHPDGATERPLTHTEVAYRFLDDHVASRPRPNDCRRAPRNRTRLRSARIIDLEGSFICHCRVHDRSPIGIRIALDRNRSLPARFLVLDDETETLGAAHVVWRDNLMVGLRINAPSPRALRTADLYALRNGYYAVPAR